jgi:arylsulfatase A-like enzyme
VVTADHGRSNAFMHHGGVPEAARVWALFAGSVVTARGRPVTAPRRLADIAPTIRSTVGLASDTNPAAGTSLLAWLAPSEPAYARVATSSARVALSASN